MSSVSWKCWRPNSCTFVCWCGQQQRKIWMPLDAQGFVVMLEHLHNVHFLKVHRICNNYVFVKTSTCHVASICRVWDTSNIAFMKFIVGHQLAHLQIPDWYDSIDMSYRCLTIDESRVLASWSIEFRIQAYVLIRTQRDFSHFCKLWAIHLVDVLFAPYIPNLDHLVCANRDGKWSIKRRLYGKYIALMSFQIGDILSSFSIPYLHITLHQTTRKQNCWINWIETDRPHYGFMTS